jgi:hypothetical protein
VANPNSAATIITMSSAQSVTANFAAATTTLGGTLSSKSGSPSARQWVLSIKNNGPGVANGVALTGFTLTQTGGKACTPVVPSLPVSVGNLAPGASAPLTLTINFSSCAGNTKFTMDAELSANAGVATGSIVLSNQSR